MKEKIKVLILEDVLEDLELALFELRQGEIKFTHLHVKTEEDFKKGLIEFKPDIILSDYSLPQFNGMKALLTTKEIAPLIPFIIVTGSINEETAVNCIKSGATDYVLKENLVRLGPAVNQALERKALIKAKMKAEVALSESVGILNQFMLASPELMYIKDEKHRFYKLSKGFEKLFGKPVSELIGKDLYDLLPPEVAKTVSEDDLKVLQEGVKVSAEEKVNDQFFSSIKFPIHRESGKPDYLGGYSIDITERKQAGEKLKSKLEQLEMFNNITVDRELKINETRKEVNELLKQMGKDPKYKIV
ncbi:MAG: PAS domain-containing protein [Candidatus Cloacimonetes bacterium]|jgi:PAS domain S-box-containing protein|nr:PAS domain-containing protein [Candidatus Cloacimonadota bacterium]